MKKDHKNIALQVPPVQLTRNLGLFEAIIIAMIAQQITGQVRCATLLTKTNSPSRAGLKKPIIVHEYDS
jgi:hypothetical protein